jgi:hypothetical protein
MVEHFEVEAGIDRELGELTLQTISDLVQLRVTDMNDKPIPMYMVALAPMSHPMYVSMRSPLKWNSVEPAPPPDYYFRWNALVETFLLTDLDNLSATTTIMIAPDSHQLFVQAPGHEKAAIDFSELRDGVVHCRLRAAAALRIRVTIPELPPGWRLIALPTSRAQYYLRASDLKHLCYPVMMDVTRGGEFVFHGSYSKGYDCALFAVRSKGNRVVVPVDYKLIKYGVMLDSTGIVEVSISASDLQSLPK